MDMQVSMIAPKSIKESVELTINKYNYNFTYVYNEMYWLIFCYDDAMLSKKKTYFNFSKKRVILPYQETILFAELYYLWNPQNSAFKWFRG